VLRETPLPLGENDPRAGDTWLTPRLYFYCQRAKGGGGVTGVGPLLGTFGHCWGRCWRVLPVAQRIAKTIARRRVLGFLLSGMRAPLALSVIVSSIARASCVGPLVFEDNFTGPLNTSRWHVQTGVHIHGIYEATNVFTANDSLILQTVACNQTIGGVRYFLSSGAVDTSTSFTQQWGTWEARV
jgi:hypothetical protein